MLSPCCPSCSQLGTPTWYLGSCSCPGWHFPQGSTESDSKPPSESVAELGIKQKSFAQNIHLASSSGEVGCIQGDFACFSSFQRIRAADITQQMPCSKLHLQDWLLRK